jgi:GTP-binding protein
LPTPDEPNVAVREVVVAATLAALARRPAAFPEIIFTSARTGEGIDLLRGAIARLLAERKS